MNRTELLKRARDIVAGLIAHRTPDVKSTCERAFKRLGEVCEMAKAMQPGEAVSAPFAMGVSQVIDYLDAFRSGYASNDPSQTIAAETAAETVRNESRIGKADAKLAKDLDPGKDKATAVAKSTGKTLNPAQFAAYLKTEVDGAMALQTGPCLKRLHNLHNAINKAMAAETLPGETNAASFEETAVFTVPVDVDANQIITTDATQSAAANQAAAPAADSNFESPPGGSAPGVAGNAKDGSVMSEANKNDSATTENNWEAAGGVLKSLADSVEKAGSSRVSAQDIGWTMDLADSEFLTNQRRVDFGRDGTK